jgi:hypothetical protein
MPDKRGKSKKSTAKDQDKFAKKLTKSMAKNLAHNQEHPEEYAQHEDEVGKALDEVMKKKDHEEE